MDCGRTQRGGGGEDDVEGPGMHGMQWIRVLERVIAIMDGKIY